MIRVNIIEHDRFSALLKEYEEALSHLKPPPFHIETLYSYTKYLSRLIKSIDTTSIRELKERIDFNNELEKKLQLHGNDEKSLGGHNPKLILLKIADLLADENRKFEILFQVINQNFKQRIPTLIIANNEDIEFISENILLKGTHYLHTIQYSQLDKFVKKFDPKNFYIIDFALEGYNDFLKYYNYDFTLNLLLYPHENEIYESCLRKYQRELETELTSSFREEFTGLKYEAVSLTFIEKPLSKTIQDIVDSAKEYREEDDFTAIKENPELDTPEVIHYIIGYIELECYWDELDSSDYVFNEQNKLVKIGRVKESERIRIYNEKLNINLYEIAAEEDEGTFNLIEYYSDLWHKSLWEYYLSNSISIDELYFRLKKHGLSVQQTTLNNYLEKRVRFPMRKSDLDAILRLTKNEELEKNISGLLKYKRIYNGVMIALGKNLKEEICKYLQSKALGNILKGTFTKEMLDNFIESSMPLRTVKTIKRKIITEQ